MHVSVTVHFRCTHQATVTSHDTLLIARLHCDSCPRRQQKSYGDSFLADSSQSLSVIRASRWYRTSVYFRLPSSRSLRKLHQPRLLSGSSVTTDSWRVNRYSWPNSVMYASSQEESRCLYCVDVQSLIDSDRTLIVFTRNLMFALIRRHSGQGQTPVSSSDSMSA